MLRFIDLQERPDSDGARTTSLSFTDKDPGYLTVVGVLPHGTEIRPKTRRDAENLILWLNVVKHDLER